MHLRRKSHPDRRSHGRPRAIEYTAALPSHRGHLSAGSTPSCPLAVARHREVSSFGASRLPLRCDFPRLTRGLWAPAPRGRLVRWSLMISPKCPSGWAEALRGWFDPPTPDRGVALDDEPWGGGGLGQQLGVGGGKDAR